MDQPYADASPALASYLTRRRALMQQQAARNLAAAGGTIPMQSGALADRVAMSQSRNRVGDYRRGLTNAGVVLPQPKSPMMPEEDRFADSDEDIARKERMGKLAMVGRIGAVDRSTPEGNAQADIIAKNRAAARLKEQSVAADAARGVMANRRAQLQIQNPSATPMEIAAAGGSRPTPALRNYQRYQARRQMMNQRAMDQTAPAIAMIRAQMQPPAAQGDPMQALYHKAAVAQALKEAGMAPEEALKMAGLSGGAGGMPNIPPQSIPGGPIRSTSPHPGYVIGNISGF